MCIGVYAHPRGYIKHTPQTQDMSPGPRMDPTASLLIDLEWLQLSPSNPTPTHESREITITFRKGSEYDSPNSV